MAPFPATRPSVIRALNTDDRETRDRARETLAATYWKPVYKYVRLRWNASREDAEDLTQDFFIQAFDRSTLERYDARRARFRTFLRTCVDGVVANARRDATRAKRGGAITFVPMDFAGAELELAGIAPPADAQLDDFFRREWVRAVFEQTIERLRRECRAEGREQHFALFMRYDVEPLDDGARPTYARLARDLGLPETQVTNFLALARRRFRHHVLEVLVDLTGNDDEYAEAARDLLGVDA
jgi:RNA polymerase sigma factor (sigma-70 family)